MEGGGLRDREEDVDGVGVRLLMAAVVVAVATYLLLLLRAAFSKPVGT